MPKDKKDLNDFFKAVKNNESNDYPGLEAQRKSFVRKVFLNKWFLFIVFALGIVICLISQGIIK